VTVPPLNAPWSLGGLALPNRAVLAPLAGVSDVPFRRVCTGMGAGLTYVEMLSAVALLHRSRLTMQMTARHESENVLGVQVTGATPMEVAAAVRILDESGFDTIDINMGCPVRKIISSGWGCAFLKDPERVSETVRVARAATRKPLSVKCRIGFGRDAVNIGEVAARVAAEGADLLTVHGRVRTDDYSVRVRMDDIAAGFAAARAAAPGRIVCVGNGDVMDHESAAAMMDRTGADAVMVSRGALGNPWIFRELLTGRPAHPGAAEWKEVVLRHLDYHEEFHGEGLLSACKTRKHLIWYASGFPRSNRLRERCNSVASLREAREVIGEFAATIPAGLRRYEDPESTRRTSEPKHEMDRIADRAVGEEHLPQAAVP
jgi:tRNA-dihydrouridine synthase B